LTITYIIGNQGKSFIAEAIADKLTKQSKNTVIHHEGASNEQIKERLKEHSDVIVCWKDEVPEHMVEPDFLILTTQNPNPNQNFEDHWVVKKNGSINSTLAIKQITS
jgi:hypothetical protein